MSAYRYRTLRYFTIVFGLTTACWLLGAGLLSHSAGQGLAMMALLAGLLTPWLVSLIFVRRSGDDALRREHRRRLFDLRRIRPGVFLAACLLMPISVVLAIAGSIPFGGSWEQLQAADGFSFAIATVPSLAVLLLAAAGEELGWRGYAFDALQQRFPLPVATLVFGILWSLWHLPLVLVPGSYQHELATTSVLHLANFFISIVPMGVIISWVCLRQGKSIPAAIAFHFVINLSQEGLAIEQQTKCLQTLVLTAVAAVLLWRLRQPQATPTPVAEQPELVAAGPAPQHGVFVQLVLIGLILLQGIGLFAWGRAWLHHEAPAELLVSGLALQGGWLFLLVLVLRRPTARAPVLLVSAAAMLLGNLVHSALGHATGGLDGLGVALNSLIGLALAALVLLAAHRARTRTVAVASVPSLQPAIPG